MARGAPGDEPLITIFGDERLAVEEFGASPLNRFGEVFSLDLDGIVFCLTEMVSLPMDTDHSRLQWETANRSE